MYQASLQARLGQARGSKPFVLRIVFFRKQAAGAVFVLPLAREQIFPECET